MMKDILQIASIGLDFIQADGRRSTSCQLLENGNAIATAQFFDGKLSGHRAVYNANLPAFFAQCSVLIRDSKPE